MRITSLSDIPETEVSHNKKIKKQVMISKGEQPLVTNFSRAVFPPGEIADGHSHKDMSEVFFIHSGAGEISIDGQVYDLRPGMCITIEPNEQHELRNTGQEDLCVLYFGIEHQL